MSPQRILRCFACPHPNGCATDFMCERGFGGMDMAHDTDRIVALEQAYTAALAEKDREILALKDSARIAPTDVLRAKDREIQELRGEVLALAHEVERYSAAVQAAEKNLAAAGRLDRAYERLAGAAGDVLRASIDSDQDPNVIGEGLGRLSLALRAVAVAKGEMP